ncbi:hypothetical protein ACFX12_003924 [Malus domestica]
MQSRFKLKLLNIFRSLFGSCRTRNLSNEIEKALCLPENQQDLHAAEPLPKQLLHRQFPSICRPKCSNLNQSTISTKDAMLPRCHAASWSSARVRVPILWLCFSGRNLGKLDSTLRQVTVWFQNRRAWWKTKQLELDSDLLKSFSSSWNSSSVHPSSSKGATCSTEATITPTTLFSISVTITLAVLNHVIKRHIQSSRSWRKAKTGSRKQKQGTNGSLKT